MAEKSFEEADREIHNKFLAVLYDNLSRFRFRDMMDFDIYELFYRAGRVDALAEELERSKADLV